MEQGLFRKVILIEHFSHSLINFCSKTSKTPWVVIFNSGMTGKARNDSVPKGAASGHPSACAARLTSSSSRADLIGLIERQQAGDRQRQDRLHVTRRGGDETAAVFREGSSTDEHVARIGTSNDQVVRIVRDG